MMSLCWCCHSAEQPEAAASPGHRRKPVCVDSHLRSEDEQPAAVGPEQQQSDRPATGHGQVTDDIITTYKLFTLSISLILKIHRNHLCHCCLLKERLHRDVVSMTRHISDLCLAWIMNIYRTTSLSLPQCKKTDAPLMNTFQWTSHGAETWEPSSVKSCSLL